MSEHPLHVVAVTGFVRDASGRVLLVRVVDRAYRLDPSEAIDARAL